MIRDKLIPEVSECADYLRFHLKRGMKVTIMFSDKDKVLIWSDDEYTELIRLLEARWLKASTDDTNKKRRPTGK